MFVIGVFILTLRRIMSAVATIRTVVAMLHTELPGPDRKRLPKDYRYRLAYRNLKRNAVGCIMLWDVHGGRSPDQIAIERNEQGHIVPHCTCADAVFRGHLHNHVCKHVRGILQLRRTANSQVEAA
jgi:hypothetical protein